MTPRLAILGGTFDPIHIGHLAIAEDVRAALKADTVIFVPAAQQPLKAHAHSASAVARLTMTSLATADNPAFAVSDFEVQRGGLSYTVDTVAALHQQYTDSDLYFVVGADAAADLARWHEVERLLHLCRLAVVQRPGYELNAELMVRQLPALRERLTIIEGPALDISASDIRQRLRDHRPVRYHLHPRVLEYIEVHQIYRD